MGHFQGRGVYPFRVQNLCSLKISRGCKGKKYYAVNSRNLSRATNSIYQNFPKRPNGAQTTGCTRQSNHFCLWSNMWSKSKHQNSSAPKSAKNKEIRPEIQSFKPDFGGRYRTRTCDLPHVKHTHKTPLSVDTRHFTFILIFVLPRILPRKCGRYCIN